MIAVPARVTFVITGLGTGGAETMLFKLLSELNRTRFQPRVISLTRGGTFRTKIQALGIQVQEIGMRPGRVGPRGLRRLIREIRRARPDVVQTWMYHADLLGTVAARMSGRAPVIWNIRQGHADVRGNGTRTMATLRLCACLSRWLPFRIVCCGYASARAHARLGYAKSRLTVIPNGFDLTRFRPQPDARAAVLDELKLPRTSVIVGHVARYHEQKDYPNLIEAARTAARQNPNLHWILVGEGVDGSNDSLRHGLAELRGRVHLLGRREDVPRLQAAFDMATISSRAEGFPNTIGEAMASETPCVVTDVGDAAMLVGDTGLVVPAQAPGRLAEAWLALADRSASERSQLGARARGRIRSHFDVAQVATRYERLYEQALRRAS